jgi:hypothetical protein
MHRLQHPPNILLTLFFLLYDDEVVSEDVFRTWRTVDDPSEQSGKALAAPSVFQFYQWLDEGNTAEDT